MRNTVPIKRRTILVGPPDPEVLGTPIAFTPFGRVEPPSPGDIEMSPEDSLFSPSPAHVEETKEVDSEMDWGYYSHIQIAAMTLVLSGMTQ